jgi:hypothetical protein
MKQAFDDTFSQAVDALPGNAPIQEAAVAARRAAATRAGKFRQKDIIEDLMSFKKGTVTERISDAEVFDKLFAGNKKLQNIRRAKTILTQNPTANSVQAWKGIQAQGALEILEKAVSETPDGFVVSGAKLNSALDRFGQQELETLLGKKAFQQFKALQGVVGDVTIPVPRTTNPSGTAQRIMNTLSRLISVQQGGIVDKATSLLGVGAGAIKDASRRQEVLNGITRGAEPRAKVNAYLQLATHLAVTRGGVEETRE